MVNSIRTADAGNPIALSASALSKTYRVWDNPYNRLTVEFAEGLHRWGTRCLGHDHRLSQRLEQRSRRGFRDVHALRHVSFEIGRGEVVGIIGYNGAGKSTLLQILAGTLTPTAGRIEVNGRVAALLELGSGINPNFTGRENAFMYGAILGFPRRVLEQRMHAIEEFAEIGEFIDEPVTTYSTGMVTRLAFSVLTQLDPDILIVDEALSVGDAYFQNKCVNLIRRFQQEGKTMLVVSHATNTIKSMCTRAIILERGAVIREGGAAAVCDYYNALVAKKQKDYDIQQIEQEKGRVTTRSGDRRAAIGDVDVLNPAGISARAFTVGEEARVTCAIEFSSPVQNPTVGLLVRDRMGNDVFGSNTHHQQLMLGSFTGGARCEVTFVLKLNLAPGRYSVSIAVHSGHDHLTDNYDWQDNVIVFEVTPGSEHAFIGTAWLPLEIKVDRERVTILRDYDWGRVLDFSLGGNAVRHKNSGWAAPESEFTWTAANEAVLRFDLTASPMERSLRVRAAGFCTARIKVQRVEVLLDEEKIADWEVGEVAEYVASLPANLLASEARHRIRFILPDAISPEAEGIVGDTRLLGIRVFSVRIE